ncbi:hypothetical protein Tco_0180664 [Tanacetum coccineum]
MTSYAFQEDVASPVGFAKARSRGKTTILRTCFAGFQPTPSLISSQPAWELEGSNGSKMAGKRRSSIQDDLGYGGPMHRIREKADPCSQGSSLSKHKSKFDLSAQRLLLRSEPEQKASKAIVKNGEISMRNSGFVPTASSKMASKILEHLERTIPKEKPSSSARKTEKSATKLTSNLALDKVESSKFLLSSQNNKKSEGQHPIEENGPQRFAVPLIVLSSMNGNSTAPTTNAPSTLALPAEPPQKKPAFQMSAPKVSDDDNHSTAPPVQGNAPTTNAAYTLALPAEPPQKKQMSAHEDFKVSDDDTHSTAPPVQGNTQTTNAASTLALPAEPPQKKQMSAHEDFDMSMKDNTYLAPPVQGNAPTTNAASTLALPAEPPQKKHMSAHETKTISNRAPPVRMDNATNTNASSTLALPAQPRQKKQMSAHEVSDNDNHSIAPPVQGNAPTTNAASTLAPPAKPPQKKPAFQMSTHEVFEVLDDDNHSTAPVQGNASTTNAVSTWSLPGFCILWFVKRAGFLLDVYANDLFKDTHSRSFYCFQAITVNEGFQLFSTLSSSTLDASNVTTARTSLGEQWRKVMVPSPSSSDLETIVKACSNDDEVAEKISFPRLASNSTGTSFRTTQKGAENVNDRPAPEPLRGAD